MLRVRLLLFALYRDLAGTGELQLELPTGSTAATLVAGLRERGGPLGRLPAQPAVAINRTYATLDTPLSDGDEVALLPPVAGG
jgi:molybdopterin converting factor subunit 1